MLMRRWTIVVLFIVCLSKSYVLKYCCCLTSKNVYVGLFSELKGVSMALNGFSQLPNRIRII